jgi:magnesium-transporting ATPase (P-type)
VDSCDVFARVSPAQKFDIIKALKRDYVVGYQGDGINDAPALKMADVALAVDTATDVAKESADIVLLDQDMGVVINGIEEGRTIFLNIDKYLKYTMVGNFGNLFALVILYLASLNLPLLPVQLLLTSLIPDVPLITIASDRVDSKEATRPERYNTRSLMSISLVLGSCTAVFELLYFELVSSRPLPFVQTSMFLFLTLLQFIVIVSIRNHSYFWRGGEAISAVGDGRRARVYRLVRAALCPLHSSAVLVYGSAFARPSGHSGACPGLPGNLGFGQGQVLQMGGKDRYSEICSEEMTSLEEEDPGPRVKRRVSPASRPARSFFRPGGPRTCQ